jgi:hypothetical protein
MKKYIDYRLTIFIVALLTIAGCQDIDLLPKDNLPDQLFWKTPADYAKEVNQLYSRTETFGTKDTDSDIGFELNTNSVSNGTFSAPNSDSEWSDSFVDLRQCNTIIEKGESYEGSFAEIGRYVAEARFFRAYTHWRLMKRFNEIPVLTKPLTIESPELYGSRMPQKEVEDFILSELEAIYTQLPKQSELKSNETGRITQGAALALKARVALFAGTWAKYHQHRTDDQQLLEQAIQAAQRVIDSKEYTLFEDKGAESYRYLFIDEGDNASEEIFGSRYYDDIRVHGTAHSVFWGWRGTPTKKMADMYLCKTSGLPIEHPNSGFHGREKITDEFEDRDPRMLQTILMPGTSYRNAQHGPDVCSSKFTTRPETRTGYKLWKFMGEVFGKPSDKDSYDYHIIRYAEVLLILAEATFEKDGSVSDDVLNQSVNVVRSRKGVEMPPLTNQFVRDNGLDMQMEIRRERTVELAFEGFRRDDLRRWKTAEAELKKAIMGIKYTGTEYEEQQALNDGYSGLIDADGFLVIEPEGNRFYSVPKHYYYSLPLDELYLNPNLAPNNPGW